MRRRLRLPSHDDLFHLFPDLPRPRPPVIDGQRSRVLKLVAAARARVLENARRQMAASQRIRDQVATRKMAQLPRRRSSIS